MTWQRYTSNQEGFISTITVIILSVITLTLAVAVAMLGANELVLGNAASQSQKAFEIADGCQEEAYYRLKLSSAYTGGTIPYGSGNCTVTVSGSGTTRTVVSTATIGGYTRSMTATVSLVNNTATNANSVDVTHWQEP